MAALGLYIHVPFCAAICHYCNFTRDLFDPELKQRFVSAVIRDIGARGRDPSSAAGLRADTVFFGGGTPSVLEPDEIARIVSACRAVFDVSADAEVTLEANPETVDVARFLGYRDAGVTRLSMGVQSFRDDELRRLGRLHDASRARRALDDARTAGFENISLDLMMWLPAQTVSDWLESVEALVAAAPPHASLYMLELYPNAPLRDEMARARWSLAPDDDAADMYERALERLDRAGYAQYEISNVSTPGRECRHNLKYWSDGEWLGFGPGAHSTFGGARWKNAPGITDYVSCIEECRAAVVERRVLSRGEACQEALITGLRLNAGVDERAVAEKYGLDLWARYGHHLQPYLDEGLLVHEGGRLALTRRGMLLANEILAVFI